MFESSLCAPDDQTTPSCFKCTDAGLYSRHSPHSKVVWLPFSQMLLTEDKMLVMLFPTFTSNFRRIPDFMKDISLSLSSQIEIRSK